VSGVDGRRVRVALCSASVGHGHARAAGALAKALEGLGAEVSVLDALEGAPAWFVRGYRDAYLATVRHLPPLAEAVYRLGDRPPRGVRVGSVVEGAALRGFVSRAELVGADAIVCTHFLCARVLSDLKGRGVVRAPMAVCVTDQHPHGIWLVRHAERVMVASEEALGAAERAGAGGGRAVVTGIPIDARFGEWVARGAARAGLGLEPGVPTALVSGGGLGLVEMAGVVEALAACPGARRVVVVCGHNGALRARMERLAGECGRGAGGARLTVLGYTDAMHALMRAADVLVGKPGGLTTAEAAACGLPMVLTRPIPGQEERNARRLTSLGAAVLERDPARAGRVAAALLEERGRLAAMAERSAALGRPDAAERAAGVVMGMVGRARVVVRGGVEVGAGAV
jgi:processive 1,2-diacylglycerol beta-glucosyltransferase